MIRRLAFLALVFGLVAMSVLGVSAGPQFLTSPFVDDGVVIQQGWKYVSDDGIFNCVKPFLDVAGNSHDPEGWRCHRGIDYINGTVDELHSWSSFNVVAAGDGYAVGSWSEHYGYFVYVGHSERDDLGRRFFTLYAHLLSGTATVPMRSRSDLARDISLDDFSAWGWVGRGEKLGEAGDSGSPGRLHLHFEVQRGGYPLNKVDPYDIYSTRDAYVDASCGPNFLWTQCPPVAATITPPPLPSAQVTIGPTTLNFGDVLIGSCSTAQFAIQHVLGTAPASGTVSASPNPPYSITSGSEFTAAEGAAPLVTVQFCPSVAGVVLGTATVASSATFTNTNTVSLSGTGLPAANEVALLDTLRGTSPNTTFCCVGETLGVAGTSFTQTSLAGPLFTLSQPTTITEIGAFLTLGFIPGQGVWADPNPAAIIEVRPALSDLLGRKYPDPTVVLGRYTLSHDGAANTVSFESARPILALPAGEYFAVFGTQDSTKQGLLAGIISDGQTALFFGSVTRGWVPDLGPGANPRVEMGVRIKGIPQ